MDSSDSKTLLAYIRERGGKISVDETLLLMRPLFNSLEELHKTGHIYRRVRPDNIIIEQAGEKKFVRFDESGDYGSGQKEGSSSSTISGFIPLELCHTEEREGPWTDVYGIAATIYYCITGYIPEEAVKRESALKSSEPDPLKLPTAYSIKISQATERVILKGMAVFPKDRYASLQEFENKLYEKYDAPLFSVEIPEYALRKKKRQSTVLTAVLIFSAVFILGIGVLLVLNKTEKTETVLTIKSLYDKISGSSPDQEFGSEAMNEGEEQVTDGKQDTDEGPGSSKDTVMVTAPTPALKPTPMPAPTPTPTPTSKPTPTPKPTPKATPTPMPTSKPTPTPKPAAESKADETGSEIHRYEYIVADITWEEAWQDAIDRGGYLAHMNSDDEIRYLIQELMEKELSNYCFFIGGRRPEDGQDYYWILPSGKRYGRRLNSKQYIDGQYWLPDEPSYESGGIEEYYMELLYRESEERWYWNDIPNDLCSISDYWKGRIGYIVEFTM